MQIGLDFWKPEDAEWFREIGAQWTKLNCGEAGSGNGPGEEYLELVQGASEAGLRVITDLRPSTELHLSLSRLKSEPDATAEPQLVELEKRLQEDVSTIVDRCRDWCSVWEWWGEFDCPHVGGLWPGKRAAYPHTLKAVYAGIKEAQPEAQVWNGGYGVNFQPQFIDGLVELAPQSFDKANWHHYNITDYWPRHEATGEFQWATPLHKRIAYTSNKFREMFDRCRERMASAGCGQAFVSSEWGMPVVSDEAADALKKVELHSFVFQDDVRGLGDSEAAEFCDAWLQVFKDVGFEVINYHRLHDAAPFGPDDDGTFWGAYCGLLFADGRPKPQMLDCIKRWAQKGRA